ncbi:hypothetical protein [Streptomyces avermitilis]|uniref:hypothetical protein n=1 Tax=Streptomyces avermitilis TaxID=33903 RepID=UPI00382C0988
MSKMTLPGKSKDGRALRQAAAVHPRGGGDVMTRFSLSGDLWLRVSLGLTRLLLTVRVPPPGFRDIGPFATFDTPSHPMAPLARAQCGYWQAGAAKRGRRSAGPSRPVTL